MAGMSERDVCREFCGYAGEKLRDHLAQIKRCAALLSEEQAWYRPNERSNSVANLVLHLTGNIRQWILGGLAGRPVERDRQGEFDARESVRKEEAVAGLDAAVREVCGVIEGLTPDDLMREYRIQAYTVSGVAAVMHVVEHFAFHTGQIVTTTKWLLDVDLSLYDEKGHRRDGRKADVP